jgi:Cu(I)/Ag(I) efflux system membrane fusion protein
MKKLIYLLFPILLACSKNTSKETDFFVRGNCEMCKERIENTAKSISGVTAANWDVNSSNLKVTFDSTKVKELDIHKAIAGKGHATKLVEMNTKAHDELPDCCKVSY